MLVAILVVAVVVLLLVVLRLADRRHRRNGHTNRSFGDMQSQLRRGKERKMHTQINRRDGGGWW